MAGRYTETVGQYLRRERESRSMSLEELSRATRIGLPFLEALEGDDFGFFSRSDFVLGFLRGYARHLGLEVEEILRRYRLQAELASRKENFQQMPLFPGAAGPVEETGQPEPDDSRVHRGRERKRSYLRILVQVIIVAVALGLSWYFHQLLKNSEEKEKSPPAGASVSSKGGKEVQPPKERPKP